MLKEKQNIAKKLETIHLRAGTLRVSNLTRALNALPDYHGNKGKDRSGGKEVSQDKLEQQHVYKKYNNHKSKLMA